MTTRSRMLSACFVFIASLRAFAGTPAYRLIKEIPIAHQEGGWDYLTVDSSARRLYLAQTGRVVVVDIAQDKVVGEVYDTPGVHGFALAPELGRGFSSNGKESKLSVVDLATLKTLSKVSTGENPDAILYNPAQQEVYAFNGRGKSASVIHAMTGKLKATIALPGKTEFSAIDAQSSLCQYRGQEFYKRHRFSFSQNYCRMGVSWL